MRLSSINKTFTAIYGGTMDTKDEIIKVTNGDAMQDINRDAIQETMRDEIQFVQLSMLQDYVEIMLGKKHMSKIIKACKKREGTKDNGKVASFLTIVNEKGNNRVTKRDLDITLIVYLLSNNFREHCFDIDLTGCEDDEAQKAAIKFTKKAFFNYLSGIRVNRNGISHISDVSVENKEQIHELQKQAYLYSRDFLCFLENVGWAIGDETREDYLEKYKNALNKMADEVFYSWNNKFPVTIKVIDEDDIRISGYKLKLTNSKGELISEWTTGEGDYTIDLIPGKYRIIEDDQPTGFSTSADMVIKVTEDADQEIIKRVNRDINSSLITSDNYCRINGINNFANSGQTKEHINKMLEGKEEVYIVVTTGMNLISGLAAQFIPEAIKKGVKIYILVPNKYSDFVNDVADIETLDPDMDMMDSQRLAAGRKTLAHEFSVMIEKVKNVLYTIKNEEYKGKIYLGCAFNLLRQTIIIGKTNDEIWGWNSITIPPMKAADGTPSFEFSGSLKEKNYASVVFGHVEKLISLAQKRNAFVEIDKYTDVSGFRFDIENIYGVTEKSQSSDVVNQDFEKANALEFWIDRQNIAEKNMKKHQIYKDILIEVASQHPLNSDGTPLDEFAKRLDYAYELYSKLQEKRKEDGITRNIKIYVPGSLHLYEGIPDKNSLSEAGKNYLIQKGMSESDILADDYNQKYKGDKGVYNSADECYVASQTFLNERYGVIYAVCSPNQLARKQLFYIACGVLPHFYTVPTDNMAHDSVVELIEKVPNVIYKDHDWQGEDSIYAKMSREERQPKQE